MSKAGSKTFSMSLYLISIQYEVNLAFFFFRFELDVSYCHSSCLVSEDCKQ